MKIRKFASIGLVSFVVPAMIGFAFVSFTQANPLSSEAAEVVSQVQEQKQPEAAAHKESKAAAAPASKAPDAANAQAYYTIAELGIRLAVDNSFESDLFHEAEVNDHGKFASFSARSLMKLEGTQYCSPEGRPLGSIARVKQPMVGDSTEPISQKDMAGNPSIKKLGENDYLVFYGPQALCTDGENAAAVKAQSEGVRQIMAAFQTAEVIK